MGILVRQEQCQIAVQPIVIHELQRAHLLRPELHLTKPKFLFSCIECKFLLQAAHRFKAVSVRFLYHAANGGISGWYRGIALPDVNTFWAHSLFGNVIRTVCATLNIDLNDFLSGFLNGLVVKKHGDVRLDGIPNHVADLQRRSVRVIQTNHFAVVFNANIQRSSVSVCKGNDFLFNVVHNDRLQFYGFAFPIRHIVHSFDKIISSSL